MTINSPEERKLGRKHIKGFADGIARQFSCSAEHYAWLAYQYDIPEVVIDLISLRIEPGEFDIRRNRILAGICQQTLLYNVKRLAPPGSVVSAVLTAHFGIEDYSVDGSVPTIGSSVFTVILTDERGKEWRVDHCVARTLVMN